MQVNHLIPLCTICTIYTVLCAPYAQYIVFLYNQNKYEFDLRLGWYGDTIRVSKGKGHNKGRKPIQGASHTPNQSTQQYQCSLKTTYLSRQSASVENEVTFASLFGSDGT